MRYGIFVLASVVDLLIGSIFYVELRSMVVLEFELASLVVMYILTVGNMELVNLGKRMAVLVQELLALEESIGNVSTGMTADVIEQKLKKTRYSSLDAVVARYSQECDLKCSICQVLQSSYSIEVSALFDSTR